MRRLLPTALLASSLPALVAAQSAPAAPSIWSTLLNLDTFAQRMLQGGVMALRTQVDLVYSDMSVDLFTGKVTMTELRAWPLPDWDEEGICEISIDRITLRSGAIDQPDQLRGKAQLIGAAFPTACLPPDLSEPMGMVGVQNIEIPRLTIEFDYGFPSSDLSLRIHGDLTDLATVDAEAYMTYFWFDGRDDIENPIPVVFLEHAALSLQNAGLWQAIVPLLPPPLTGEGSGLFLEGALGQELIAENRHALDDETAGLSPGQQGFLTSLKDSWPAFVADPQTLVLETTNDVDVFLDFELIDEDPREIFEALQPVVSLQSSASAELVPLSVLSAVAAGTTGELSLEERRALGLALIEGAGVPRNIAAGTDILAPFARSGDGEAAAAVALAIEHSNPDEAYLGALLGGGAEEPGMAGLMDRLEKKIGVGEALFLQDDLAGDTPIPEGAMSSLSSIRSEASMRFSGLGRTRSYEWAATWAMIGAAAGDAEAADILSEIEERMRLGGDTALEAWAEAEQRAADLAAKLWLENDLPSVLAQ